MWRGPPFAEMIPPTSSLLRRALTSAALVALMSLTACGALISFATPTPTLPPPTPSATPEPLAAEIDGERITLAEFAREALPERPAGLGIDLATVGNTANLCCGR
jgi:hypothetical protein